MINFLGPFGALRDQCEITQLLLLLLLQVFTYFIARNIHMEFNSIISGVGLRPQRLDCLISLILFNTHTHMLTTIKLFVLTFGKVIINKRHESF